MKEKRGRRGNCLFKELYDDNDNNYLRGENSFDPLKVFEVKVKNWQRAAIPCPSDHDDCDHDGDDMIMFMIMMIKMKMMLISSSYNDDDFDGDDDDLDGDPHLCDPGI